MGPFQSKLVGDFVRQNSPRHKALYIGTVLHLIENRKAQNYTTAVNLTQFKFCKMKAKSLEIEAYTITEVSRIFGYKSTRTLYNLLNKGKLDDYIWMDISGRVYLMLEPPNKIPLAKKILKNIQIRRYNAIRNSGYLKKKRFN